MKLAIATVLFLLLCTNSLAICIPGVDGAIIVRAVAADDQEPAGFHTFDSRQEPSSIPDVGPFLSADVGLAGLSAAAIGPSTPEADVEAILFQIFTSASSNPQPTSAVPLDLADADAEDNGITLETRDY